MKRLLVTGLSLIGMSCAYAQDHLMQSVSILTRQQLPIINSDNYFNWTNPYGVPIAIRRIQSAVWPNTTDGYTVIDITRTGGEKLFLDAGEGVRGREAVFSPDTMIVAAGETLHLDIVPNYSQIEVAEPAVKAEIVMWFNK